LLGKANSPEVAGAATAYDSAFGEQGLGVGVGMEKDLFKRKGKSRKID
jgi:hypothetical protein